MFRRDLEFAGLIIIINYGVTGPTPIKLNWTLVNEGLPAQRDSHSQRNPFLWIITSDIQIDFNPPTMLESYKDIENRIQKALDHITTRENSIIKHVTIEYRVSYSRLRARNKRTASKSERSSINCILNETQEAAVCRYIDTLNKKKISSKRVMIANAINKILLKTNTVSQINCH